MKCNYPVIESYLIPMPYYFLKAAPDYKSLQIVVITVVYAALLKSILHECLLKAAYPFVLRSLLCDNVNMLHYEAV